MRKYISEFIGTLVLVLFGCGSAVAANTLVSGIGVTTSLALTTLLIAFAFGLSIVAMAYSIGNISGCHINPAVSLAMLISKKMSFKDFVGYVIAQILGGIAGAWLLSVFVGSRTSLGANGFGTLSAMGTSMGVAFLIEVVLTFVFVMVILGVTSKKEYSNVSGLVIGLSLTLIHILGIPFTGTSVNPARSLGPALLTGGTAFNQVWLFILAPLVGGALAAIVWKYLNNEESLVVEENYFRKVIISNDEKNNIETKKDEEVKKVVVEEEKKTTSKKSTTSKSNSKKKTTKKKSTK